MNLLAKQGMHGNLGCFCNRIEQRHLQTRSEVVIPHQLSGILALRPLDSLIGRGIPGVIEQRLSETDVPRFQMHFDNFGIRPMR